MNDAILRRLRLILAVVALIALLVVPAAASAKRHPAKNADRNQNSVPRQVGEEVRPAREGRGQGRSRHDFSATADGVFFDTVELKDGPTP